MLTARPITLEDDAWVGARATVGPGVVVGRGAIVGLGATVAKDVPPMTLTRVATCRVTPRVKSADRDEPEGK